MWVLNLKQGPMTDKRLRQAIQAAVDVEPPMLAAMGNKDFFRLDPGLFFQEQQAWHSKAGAELYNQRDKDKARRLLKEAGYQGQPLRWIVTTEYEHHYKPALVGKAQLEEVGFKVDLQVSDWATVVQRRSKPELWDIFSTAFVVEPEPTTSPIVLCSWPGWWCHPEKEQLLQAMGRELEREEAARALGAHPGHLLRGRRPHPPRRLLPRRRPAQGAAGVPSGPVHVLLERLAREVGSSERRVRP